MIDPSLPRRIDVNQHTPAEKAIQDAVAAVEALEADVRLTDAVVLLIQAKNRVADFVDGFPSYALPGLPSRDG